MMSFSSVILFLKFDRSGVKAYQSTRSRLKNQSLLQQNFSSHIQKDDAQGKDGTGKGLCQEVRRMQPQDKPGIMPEVRIKAVQDGMTVPNLKA